MKNIIKKLWRLCGLFRHADWQDKIRINTFALLLLMVLSGQWREQWLNMFLAILYLYAAFGYCYLLNIFTDRADDLRVSKDYWRGFSEHSIKFIIFLSGAAALLFPLIFKNYIILGISVIVFMAMTFYSLKPLRFKERGAAGIIVSACAHGFPILFFALLMPLFKPLVLYLSGWLILNSFLLETAHQCEDLGNDRFTKTKTCIVHIGLNAAKRLIVTMSSALLIYLMIPVFVLKTPGLFISMALAVFS